MGNKEAKNEILGPKMLCDEQEKNKVELFNWK